MVNWIQWHCRNCKHFHNSPQGIEKCLIIVNSVIDDNGVTQNECGCENWESVDNLIYLEQKYEKSLND